MLRCARLESASVFDSKVAESATHEQSTFSADVLRCARLKPASHFDSKAAESATHDQATKYLKVLKHYVRVINLLRLTNAYVVTDDLFHNVSGCIGHNGAATSNTILSLPSPSKPVANEQMEEAGAVLENDSSTPTYLIEYFPKTTASQDILEEISPLPRSSIKDRKRKKPVQVKISKLITTRTSKEDLKMKAKMELKSEEEKRVEGGETHCIIYAEIFEEDWIQCRICEGWAHENCADLDGNNLFYECDIYVTKKM
ncbi:hypothetical protein AVEN_34613-1 [Araneus ventricosus]|uniref:Zinc finger PHD-type domain-containing protein n=1 Tax=Araneus ventricosus TaxID=182803 RepID=A0A4Y2B264_ARAVE|nr:hypothetical protein AVEN_34613-1 [Araneus ventricosus]